MKAQTLILIRLNLPLVGTFTIFLCCRVSEKTSRIQNIKHYETKEKIYKKLQNESGTLNNNSILDIFHLLLSINYHKEEFIWMYLIELFKCDINVHNIRKVPLVYSPPYLCLRLGCLCANPSVLIATINDLIVNNVNIFSLKSFPISGGSGFLRLLCTSMYYCVWNIDVSYKHKT